jgi:F0F1-type ATP synthase assembly protein I
MSSVKNTTAKNTITSILLTTGAALLLLAVFVVIIGDTFIYVNTFFQILGANIIINVGLLLTKKFESTYAILEYLLDVGYVVVVLVFSGLLFDWYSTVPVWYLVIMALIIYAIGVYVNIVRLREEAKEINKLLQKRDEMDNRTVSWS